MATVIQINSDFGEGFGVYPAPMQVWRVGLERGGNLVPEDSSFPKPRTIMEQVSVVNLACGFHAGDPLLIKKFVALAVETGCGVGAHPSFPDRAGFGNRYMALAPSDLKAVLQYQIGALAGFARMYKIPLSHVKCHGALYNSSMFDEALALTLVEAMAEYDPELPIFGLPDSVLEAVAARKGVPYRREAFADRSYHADGRLVDRSQENAMVLEPEVVARRVVKMVTDGTVTTVDGTELRLDPQTICFHADSPGALAMLDRLRRAFRESDISVERGA